MTTGKLDPAPLCPKCDSKLDGYTALTEGTPRDGDLTICCYCSCVLEFTFNLTLIEAREETLKDLDEDTRNNLKKASEFAKLMQMLKKAL